MIGRRARDQARDAGPYLRSIFISEDETWFLVYEAARVEAVCDADLSFDRVTGAVEA